MVREVGRRGRTPDPLWRGSQEDLPAYRMWEKGAIPRFWPEELEGRQFPGAVDTRNEFSASAVQQCG